MAGLLQLGMWKRYHTKQLEPISYAWNGLQKPMMNLSQVTSFQMKFKPSTFWIWTKITADVQ